MPWSPQRPRRQNEKRDAGEPLAAGGRGRALLHILPRPRGRAQRLSLQVGSTHAVGQRVTPRVRMNSAIAASVAGSTKGSPATVFSRISISVALC